VRVVLEADSPQGVSLARLPLLPKDTREKFGFGLSRRRSVFAVSQLILYQSLSKTKEEN
jgi:hypothetical protein